MTALADETMAVLGGQWQTPVPGARVFCELPAGVEGEGATLLLGLKAANRTAEPGELLARVTALWESRGYVLRADGGEIFGRAPDGGSLSFAAGEPQGRMTLNGEGSCRVRPPL